MSVCSRSFALVLCALFSFALVTRSAAQGADGEGTREVDLDADLLEGAVENGVSIRRLTNARLRQGTTYVTSIRAIEYVASREYLFEGNVVITDEGDTLSARRVFYDSRSKVGRATGDVRISDGEIEVFAPSGTYYMDEKRAEFLAGVRLVDSTTEVSSNRGIYWSDEKRGAFMDDVTLREPGTFLQADSLTVLREVDQSIASGDVFIRRFGRGERRADVEIDSSVVTYLLGAEAYNDEERQYSRVTGSPLVLQLRVDSVGTRVDTTVVRASVIEVTREDVLDRLLAIDSVRVLQGSLAAIGDSLVYDRIVQPDETSVDRLYLFGSPVAWFETSQVFGDTVHVVSGSSPTDTLFAWGNAFVAQEDTALGSINQLAGRSLTALFEDDTLRTLRLGPNARAIRYLTGEDGSLSWAVQSSGDSVVIHTLEGGDADVTFGSGTEGTAYPPALIPSPFQLDGYRWEPQLRPTLEGLVDFDGLAARIRMAQNPASVVTAERAP